MKLEICIDNIEDIKICNKYAKYISRIELNMALSAGGLTPTLELLKEARKLLDPSIKIMCMIRIRSGHFYYSDWEFNVMKKDAISLIKYCDGLVFGALNSDNSIDIQKTKEIIKICKEFNKEFVFHRAIDVTKDYFKSLEILENLKIDRLLTSGHEKTAEIGINNLKKIKCNFELLAGCGINPDNIYLFKDFQVHGSFSKIIETNFGYFSIIDEEKLIKIIESGLFKNIYNNKI